MVEFKGTKEPWVMTSLPFETNTDSVASIYGEYEAISPTDGGSYLIADISKSPGYEKAKANAKLISKAPEMLQMLENMKNELSWCISKLQEYGEEVDFQTPAEADKLINETI
ncbi:hypothetical protein BAS10_04620 [Elizabethkingia meningoseptica]|uniref:hypothetical protein n=1 Tax=Elizabethkingia meningoseptica TaxID=238 RepID=UPI000999ABC4|nr:hypothetical protein [Elizabethkingia meningoseptica]OPB98954.1 hypothetical protein BAS10_04620 [Elizabethkingia meningoseptica]